MDTKLKLKKLHLIQNMGFINNLQKSLTQYHTTYHDELWIRMKLVIGLCYGPVKSLSSTLQFRVLTMKNEMKINEDDRSLSKLGNTICITKTSSQFIHLILQMQSFPLPSHESDIPKSLSCNLGCCPLSLPICGPLSHFGCSSKHSFHLLVLYGLVMYYFW